MTISPGVRRRQQQLARVARRAPGYRFALEQVLPRVRRSPVLNDLAWRVLAPRHGAGNVQVALLPDRHVTGPDVARLPVVGILGTGLTQEQAAELVEHVAALQQEHGSFRPVLVLDQPVLASARAHGYVVELVVPQAAWASGDFVADPVTATGADNPGSTDPDSWATYLARRLGSITDHYQLWHLARVVTRDGIPRLDPLDQALLAHLHERLPADVQAWTRSTRPAEEDHPS